MLTAQILGLACAVPRPRIPAFKSSSTIQTSARLYTGIVLALCAVLSVLATLYHLPVTPPMPFRPGARIVRAGIWTVHFGIDNVGRDSQQGMRSLIHDMELDVVGLLETDLHRVVYGNRDL